jgi:hypothetical protein
MHNKVQLAATSVSSRGGSLTTPPVCLSHPVGRAHTLGSGRATSALAPAGRGSETGIQGFEVDGGVASRLLSERKKSPMFSDALNQQTDSSLRVGMGDTLAIRPCGAPLATLFSDVAPDLGFSSTSRPTTLPEQAVDHDGSVAAPLACRAVPVGQTLWAFDHVERT